jgi:cyanate permease
MLAAGAAMAVAGIVWLIFVRDRVVPARHASLREVFALGRHRALRLVAVMHFLLFGGYLSLLGLLPRALTEAGIPPGQVGGAVAAWLTVAGVMNLLGPWLSDRAGGLRRPFLLGGAALAGLALGAFALDPSRTWLLAVAALGGGVVAPLLLTLPLELQGIGPTRAGSALGLLMLVGQAGGFLLPVLAGKLQAVAGLQASLGLLAVAHLAIVLPAFALAEPRGRAIAQAPAPVPADDLAA